MKKQAHTLLPSIYGDFELYAFSDDEHEVQPHLAMVHKDMDISSVVPVRFHSECITGDLLGSKRCDCGQQLRAALKIIEEQKGILLYLRQEGRGIGLINKLKAYQLQDGGMNTIEANVHLGFEPDERDYDEAIKILDLLHVTHIKLITNNPLKLNALDGSNIKLEGRIPIIIDAYPENKDYLDVKAEKMGHMLDTLR